MELVQHARTLKPQQGPGVISSYHDGPSRKVRLLADAPPLGSSHAAEPPQKVRRLADAPPLGTSKVAADVPPATAVSDRLPGLCTSNSPASLPPLSSAQSADAQALATIRAGATQPLPKSRLGPRSQTLAASQPGNSATAEQPAAGAANARLGSRWGPDPADAGRDAEWQHDRPATQAATNAAIVTQELPRQSLPAHATGNAAGRTSTQRVEGSVAAAVAAGQPARQRGAKPKRKPGQQPSTMPAGDVASRAGAAVSGKVPAPAGLEAKRPSKLPRVPPASNPHASSATDIAAALPSAPAAQLKSGIASAEKRSVQRSVSAATRGDRKAAAAVSAVLDGILPSAALLPSPLVHGDATAVSSAELTRPGESGSVAAAAADDLPPHMLVPGGHLAATRQWEAEPATLLAGPVIGADAALVGERPPHAPAPIAKPALRSRVPAHASLPALTTSKSLANHAGAQLAGKLPANARPVLTIGAGASAGRPAVQPAGDAFRAPTASAATAPAQALPPSAVAAVSTVVVGTRPAAPHAQRYVPTGRPEQSSASAARALTVRVAGLQTAVRPAATRGMLRDAGPPAPDPNLIITFESSDDEEGQIGVAVPASPAEAALHRAAQAAEAAGAPPARPAAKADDALARQMAELRAAIAAREREAAQREREAAATAFLESLSLPEAAAAPPVAPFAPADAPASPPAAEPAAPNVKLVSSSPTETQSAAVDPIPQADMAQARAAPPHSAPASPAQSGSSRRSRPSRKRAAALQDSSAVQGVSPGVSSGAEDQDRSLAPADAGLDEATREQLLAELAVIQVCLSAF